MLAAIHDAKYARNVNNNAVLTAIKFDQGTFQAPGRQPVHPEPADLFGVHSSPVRLAPWN